ncbi:hypothetical protein ABZS88_40330 [Streptomyces sp. NPDC005480]|uniref:hypothetical protein n=1 Tax=Streptomyces sp. NPDC005480 TaxID=3154880 RepID=UPI0033A85982
MGARHGSSHRAPAARDGAGFDVEDLEAPRRNVLVFHGVGGIGKTTLSRKVEAALGGSGRPEQWG